MIELNDLGSFDDINAVWKKYPEGGKEGDYLTIGDVRYRWNKYDRMWVSEDKVIETPARRTKTFFGDVAVHHDLTVAGTILARRIKQPYCGMFASVEALQMTIPNPSKGMWAIVGDTVPAPIYRCDEDGTWTPTGAVGGTDGGANIELRATEEYIQWKYVWDTEWTDLVSIADVYTALVQEPGNSKDLVMSQYAVTRELNSIQETVNIVPTLDADLKTLANQKVTPSQLSESTLQLISASGGGSISNFPDEEDITVVDTDVSPVLKLADKAYNSAKFSGKGRKYLRINLVESRNVLTQDDFTDSNTTYHIQYDYDLQGAEITMPVGCAMRFEGGCLRNGTIIGSKTLICGDLADIFDNVVLKGSFENMACNLVWWGVKSDEGFDNSSKIQNAFDGDIPTIIVSGKYYISQPVSLPHNKQIIGATGFLYNQTGFLANDDFSSIVVDFPARNGKEAFSQEVFGMFYHRDGHASSMTNIFIDARNIAKYCVEHIDLYGAINMKFVGLYNANIAGVLQYACEFPVFEDIYVTGCRIGVFVSTTKIVDADPLFSSGERIGSANLVAMTRVRVIGCNYGIVIKGSSNFGMTDCETAYNAVLGLYAYSTSGCISNFYSEGDGLCNFWIDANGVKTTAEDGFSLEYLVTNNIDGIASSEVLEFNKEVIYWRAPMLFDTSNISLSTPFVSVKPRSYEAQNAQVIENPNERAASGVDAIILTINSYLSVTNPRVYVMSSNTQMLPLFEIVDIVRQITQNLSLVELRDSRGGKRFSTPYYVAGSYAINSDRSDVYSIAAESNKLGCRNLSRLIFKDFNNNVGASRYGVSREHNIIEEQFVESDNNFPLFKITSDNAAYRSIYLTPDTLKSIFGDARQCKIVAFAKITENIESERIQIATFFRNSGTYIGGNSLDAGSPRSYSKGLFRYEIVITLRLNQEWDSLQIAFSAVNYDKVFLSDIYFYEVDDWKMSDPVYPALYLESGTFDNRPNHAPIGFAYFCTDKNAEGASNGIMIYHKDIDVWVDALGREVVA